MEKENFQEIDETLEEKLERKPKQKKRKKKQKKKEGKTRKQKKKKSHHIFRKLFLLAFIGAMIAVVVFGIKTYDKIKDDLTEAIDKSNQIIAKMSIDDFNSRVSTNIYDKDGNLLKELKTVDYIYKTYNEINPRVWDALVAVEDSRFYEHDGLDLKGFIRAMYSTVVKHQKQGGSTITQQLAKNVYLTMDQTVWRKISEAIIAEELETRYSKHQILEFYVNNINYGNGCYSIESAANYYFGKNTTDLSIAEIALLTGIPNNPTLYDPINNFDNALKRKDKVLKAMYRENMLTDKEYEEEKAREIILSINGTVIDNLISDYAQSYAVSEAVESLMNYYGFEFKYDFNSEEERDTYFQTYSNEYKKYYSEIVSGGYDIYTSIDPNVQSRLQDIVNDEMSIFADVNEETGIYAKQASATVIDNKTGLVVGIVGGRTQDGVNNSYNRAALAARQPGSTIKPIIVYTPAMELGYNANSTLVDEAIEDGPKNAYTGYAGKVSLRYAVEQSINTTAYKLTSEIGIDKSLSYLSNMKFKDLSSYDKQANSIGLGGFTYGTTTVERASAYSTLARNGQYMDATNLTKVYDRTAKTTIYENTYEKTKIYDDGAAYLMTDVLKSVITNGTGMNYKLDGVKEQAGKTGTTNDAKDLWFCGYTPNYAMSVWVGDDTPSPQGDITAQGYIWKRMMSTLNNSGEFPKPQSVYTENGTLKYSKDTASNLEKVNEDKEASRIASENEAVAAFRIKEKTATTKESLAYAYIDLFNNYVISDSSEFSTINSFIKNGDKLMESIDNEDLKKEYKDAKKDLQARVASMKSYYEQDTSKSQMDDIWNNIKNDFYIKKPDFVEETSTETKDDQTIDNKDDEIKTDPSDEGTKDDSDIDDGKDEETPEISNTQIRN